MPVATHTHTHKTAIILSAIALTEGVWLGANLYAYPRGWLRPVLEVCVVHIDGFSVRRKKDDGYVVIPAQCASRPAYDP
jgi:hypothetical protein